jgi:cyclophilin family peptidyl-prolyl cis-trans isomerase
MAAGGGAGSSQQRVYLDIDINGHRAAYALACEWVEKTSIKYGLSSPTLADLGGSERARLPELFESDHAFASRGRIELSPAPFERITLALHTQTAPTCCENFLRLCCGDRGKAKGSGLPLHYRGSPLHRMVAGKFIQGGDFVRGNGAGGESIWGGVFKDDAAALKARIDRRGLLCMSNTGKNTNGSQWFLTLGPLPQLTGKHCVFGEVVEGMEVLDALERVGEREERPLLPVVVADCGRVP